MSFPVIMLRVGLILAGVIGFFWFAAKTMDILMDDPWWKRVGVFLLWILILSIFVYAAKGGFASPQ